MNALLSSESSSMNNSTTYPISNEEIYSVLRSLPNNKSGSIDNLTYEHLKFAGQGLVTVLKTLFNSILLKERLPSSFKKGLTIILHKGKGKSASITIEHFRCYLLYQRCSKKIYLKVLKIHCLK